MDQQDYYQWQGDTGEDLDIEEILEEEEEKKGEAEYYQALAEWRDAAFQIVKQMETRTEILKASLKMFPGVKNDN